MSNEDILLKRGDTTHRLLKISDDNGKVSLVTGSISPLVIGDTIYFTVKKTLSDAQPTLQKTIVVFDDGEADIEVTSTESDLLLPGSYYYDIQWTTITGEKYTILPSDPSKPCFLKVYRGVTDE